MDEIPASEFDFRDFDVREFVQRYRKRLPLPQLQKGLRAHHAATRQELVELINEKYADFVNLSSRMQGVERAVKPLRAPLEESAELTRGLHSKLGALLEQAEQMHKGLAQLRTRRDSLVAYIENAKLLDKARAAAGQSWGNPQESDDFLREHVAQENIARDLRRVRLGLGGAPSRGAEPATAEPTAAKLAGTPPLGAPAPAPGQGAGGNEPEEASEAEASAECRALLREAAEFEEAFAGGLRGRLGSRIAAAGRSWSAPPGAPEAPAGPGGPPPRAELLAIAHLARALVTLGRAGAVEEAFAEAFAQPALEAAAAAAAPEDPQRRAAEPGGSAVCVGAGAMSLGPFFDSVRLSLLAEDAPLMWFAQCFYGSAGGCVVQDQAAEGDVDSALDSALLVVPGLCLVSNAVVAPVLRYVQQVWPNVFMPAFPDVFAANYAHAAGFVRTAEARMPPSELRAFAQSAVPSDFRRKWKTQVYASLRTKEAVQRLDVAAAKSRSAMADAGSAPDAPPHAAAGRGLWLELSAELLRVLQAVWGDGWCLDALFAKCLELSLDLLARYGRAARALVAEAPPAAGWDAAAAPPCWVPASRPARLARAAADVLAVLEAAGRGAPTAWLPCLARGRLPGALGRSGADGSGRPAELVGELLREACSGLQPALEELEAAMLQPVVAQATAQLAAAIRGIPAFYRMLNKPVPTQASPYVEPALRPVQAFRELALPIAPTAVQGWIQRALEGTATEFCTQAAQLLESTHQQEASLRRLAGRGSGSDSKVSDLEKIHIQLCLDVETFISAAKELGAELAEGSALSKLDQVISPVRPTFEAHRLSKG